MAKQKGSVPTDIKAIRAAAAEAAEAAQAVATTALRIPPASIKLAAEVPDLIENLALATERLNVAVDRMERYLALAGPMLRTMDALLPQLEALVSTGNDIYRTVASMPGVSTLGRFTNRGSDAPSETKSPKSRTSKRKS